MLLFMHLFKIELWTNTLGARYDLIAYFYNQVNEYGIKLEYMHSRDFERPLIHTV